MKVLVTGGAGFVGSNLCRRLVKDDRFAEIRVIDDLSTGFRDNLNGLDVDFWERSILDEEAVAAAADACDAIVHLAALGSVPRSVEDPLASHAANATGTLNVLQAARKRGAHVVLASSSSVYGANPQMPKAESLACMPMSPYAVSKLATEQYAMAFAFCYGLDVLPFRFFNIYGPGQRAGHVYAAVIPVFADAALRGHALPMNGDGEQSRDFTFVGTVCDVIADALVRRVTADPTNLAFGTRTSLNSLTMIMEGVLGHELEVVHQAPRAGDVRHSQADDSRVRSMFPDVKPVALETGVRLTLEWMRERLDMESSPEGVHRSEDLDV